MIAHFLIKKTNLIFMAMLLQLLIIAVYFVIGVNTNMSYANKFLIGVLFGFLLLILMGKPYYLLLFLALILPFGSIKVPGTFFTAIDFIIFGITISLILNSFLMKESLFRNFTETTLIILLGLTVLVSLIHAISRGWGSVWALEQSLHFLVFILFFIVASSILESEEQLFKLALVIIFSFTIYTLMVLKGYFTGGMTFIGGLRGIKMGKGYAHANLIAYLLNPVISLALGIFLVSKNKWLKTFLMTVLGAMFFAIVLTLSRGGWIAIGCIIIYYFIKTKNIKKNLPIFILILIVLLYKNLYLIIKFRFGTTFTLAFSALVGRIHLWKSAIRIIADNFLVGVGVGNYQIIKYEYGFPWLFDPLKSRSTHNLFLEIFANLGIIGFVLFFLLCFMIFFKLNRKVKSVGNKDDYLNGIMLGIAGGLIGYIIHGIVDCPIANQSALTILGLLLAMGVSAARIAQNHDKTFYNNC
ncbi:MAG: O-antigen ligase family protein [Candidatus Stahlbacteria bacterium]|nr:O-antigen ligase family protein [Candidatus Stahlbacteria bacterium]